MKAAVLVGYGGPEVIQITTDRPKPVLAEGQVLVEVHAASVNPFDIKVREGNARSMAELEFPAVPGGDFAGIVAAVASDTTGFEVGQAVYGQAAALSGNGSFAEFTPVKASSLGPKPDSLDFVAAAAAPLVTVSAYQALVKHMNLSAKQKVLIHGGAGGIGSMAIQLAKHLGAYVATTVSSADEAFAKNLGADEVIDYRSQDFSAVLKEFDAVYDTVGGDTYANSYKVLRPGGIIVSMVEQPNEELAKHYQVKPVYQFTHVTTEKLVAVAKLIDEGVLTVPVDKTFTLEHAGEAFEYLKTGHPKGKVVITVRS